MRLTQAVSVVRSASPGSSETRAITTYFNSVCPTSWGGWDVGDYVSQWPAGFGTAVNGSTAMTTTIWNTPYSIGYTFSALGLDTGLSEAAITNANGTLLTSQIANLTPSFLTPLIDPTSDSLPSPIDDWSALNIGILPASLTAWPMMNLAFLFVRTDISWLGNEGRNSSRHDMDGLE